MNHEYGTEPIMFTSPQLSAHKRRGKEVEKQEKKSPFPTKAPILINNIR